MNDGQNLLENDLVVDSETASHLKESAVWGKFLGVLGFIYSTIIICCGIYAGYKISSYGRHYSIGGSRAIEGGTTALIYIAAGLIFFLMSLYLFRFATKTKIAITTSTQAELNAGVKNLKIYFRFAGIVSIIMLVLTMLALIGLFMAATYSRY